MNIIKRIHLPFLCASLILISGSSFAQTEAPTDFEDVPAKVVEKDGVVATRDGNVYSLKADDAKLSDILDALKEQSEITLNIDPHLLGEKYTFTMNEVSYEDIVNKLAGSHALIYEKNEDGEYQLISARLTGRQEYIEPELADLDRKGRKNLKNKTKAVKKIIGKIEGLYGYAGELNYDQAKLLSEERQAKFDALVQELIALGPGGARAMLDIYGEGARTREGLAMIKALAYIDDPEAAATLGKLFADESKYSLQREIIGSLGHRTGAESVEILANILDSEKDVRLRAPATQAMAGKVEAFDSLFAIMRSPSEDTDVKKEAVRSIGLINDDASMNALTEISSSPDYDIDLRKYTIQELGRTYGQSSIPSLTVLLESENEVIRYSAVRSLEKVGGTEALNMIQDVAKNDVSETVRANAEAILAAHSVKAPQAN